MRVRRMTSRAPGTTRTSKTRAPCSGSSRRFSVPTNPPMDAGEARALACAFDPQRLTADFYESPYATYAALRAWDPVHRCADGSYFLTRYADLDQVYRDRVLFSSDKRAVFGPVFGVTSPLYAHHTTSLVFNDAPYHTRVRRPIVEALSPSMVRGLEASITSLVDALLERLQDLRQF